MVERLNLQDDLESYFSFLAELYPANWKIRFGASPYMRKMVQPAVIENFVRDNGSFESIAGHTWMMAILNHFLIERCTSLAQCLDQQCVNELILFHDVREAHVGDTSTMQRVMQGGNTNELQEEQDLKEMLALLPGDISARILQRCEEYEDVSERHPSLEVRYVRMLDTFQAGSCMLVYGTNLPENSAILEKVTKRRMAPLSRYLIDELRFLASEKGDRVFVDAAEEVEQIARFYFDSCRARGVKLNLSEFGF